MTTEGAPEQSPWTRPGFIVAAVVVVIIVVVGVVLGVRGMSGNDDATPAPTSSGDPARPSPTATEAVDGGDASVCGLAGEELSGTVSTAPVAEWAYQGVIAYPTSPEFGPGVADASSVRTCFQHSPEGALFAAANAIAQGSDPATAEPWLNQALSDGANRDRFLSEAGAQGTSGMRLELVGFRLLAYDGDTARVDLGYQVSGAGQAGAVSAVTELVWQDGDWKVRADLEEPLDVAPVPDLAGYVSWGP